MCTVGIDGSVYKYHPKVHKLMTETINRFVDPKCKVRYLLNCHCVVSHFHSRAKADFDGRSLNYVISLSQFKLMLSEDGSGKGAALIAAVATTATSRKV